jgi:hypothetical protein
MLLQLTVIEEAIRYIDHLHQTLTTRIQQKGRQ